jgi:hypothetical protein
MRLQPAISTEGACCGVAGRTVEGRQLESVGGTRQMVSTTNSTTPSSPTADGETDFGTTAKGIASDVADRAVAAAQRLPDAATATGAQLDRANQLIKGESDEVLAVGTSLSLGLAMGLLLGGANRLLVILALIPATAMGFTLFDRHGGTRTMRPR